MDGEVVAVLLAGGLSRRMGRPDKMLRELDGETILSRVIARVRPQAGRMLINANGDPARFAEFHLPVAADVIEGHAGPLAGVLTGMEWTLANAPECRWIVTAPTDAPFLPADLVACLLAAVERDGADMACAASGGRHHPVCGLWPVDFAEQLRSAMVDENIRKVDVWTARYSLAVADWPVGPIDPFFNANRPQDLAEAARFLAGN